MLICDCMLALLIEVFVGVLVIVKWIPDDCGFVDETRRSVIALREACRRE